MASIPFPLPLSSTYHPGSLRVTLDADEYAAETLRANSAAYADGIDGEEAPYEWAVIDEDIHEVEPADILDAAGTEDIDLIVGGPPCQTFSRSNEGNRDGTNTT